MPTWPPAVREAMVDRFDFPDGFARRDTPAAGHIDELRFVDTLVRNVDERNERRIPAGCSAYLRGWAFVPAPPRLARAVLATVGDVRIDLLYGRHRPDIAAAHGVVELVTSGFQGVYPLGDLTPGRYHLRLYVLDETDGFHELPNAEPLEIVPSRALFDGTEAAEDERLQIALDGVSTLRADAVLSGKSLEIERGDIVVVKGWAVDRRERSGLAGVFAIVDGSEYVLGVHGLPRDDVAASLEMPTAKRCGFTVRVPTRTLAPGQHDIALAVLAEDKTFATMHVTLLHVT